MTDELARAGKSVMLAPLRAEDSPLLYAWINDRSLVVHSAPFRPIAPSEHDAWFEEIRQCRDARIFAIRLLADDRLIGSCQLQGISPTHRSAEFRIRIGVADARGRGFGKEATDLLLSFGFEELELHRIWLSVFASNERARRMYRRAGFRQEGLLIDAAFVEGEWIDVIVMAILRTEHLPAR